MNFSRTGEGEPRSAPRIARAENRSGQQLYMMKNGEPTMIDRNIETPSRCEVHGVNLVPGQARIIYGIWIPDELESTRRILFPHARSQVPGGGFYSPDFPTTRAILVCSACQAEQLEWTSFFKAP